MCTCSPSPHSHATCPTHLILIIILIILRKEYKLQSCSLCSFASQPFHPSSVQIFCSQAPSVSVPLPISETKFCIHAESQAKL
jgi:hypothetical protein